jgi:DNA-binding GntR family transcriptional regulator
MASVKVDAANDQPASRIDRIYQVLFKAILAKELAPGTKLNEEAIGVLFDVSRTIVRAALNRLHSESLVEFHRNRGAFVASTTQEEARQVFEARYVIEREIFYRLASSITERQLKQLEEIQERERLANQDHEAAILLAGDFHLEAARMAGNEVLRSFLKSKISRTSLILVQHSVRQDSDCSVDEHETVLAALRSRDPDVSAAAIVKHLQQVYERANIGYTARPSRNLSEILSRFV